MQLTEEEHFLRLLRAAKRDKVPKLAILDLLKPSSLDMEPAAELATRWADFMELVNRVYDA